MGRVLSKAPVVRLLWVVTDRIGHLSCFSGRQTERFQELRDFILFLGPNSIPVQCIKRNGGTAEFTTPLQECVNNVAKCVW